MAQTKLSNLVNPEVLADLVEKKLTDNMVFYPAADFDYTLTGRPGDTIKFPAFSYIGAASTLAEGSSVSIVSLNASTVSATVHKLANGVEITDEAVLSGYGDPYAEAARQVALSMDDALDKEMLGVLNSIASTMTFETSTSSTAIAVDDINSALELFGEDAEGEKILFVSPALRTKITKASGWLPASEIAADRMVRGAIGEVYGCQVVVSNRLKGTTAAAEKAFIVKPGALRVIMKRDAFVETDRNIQTFSNIITGSIHEVCYLYDASKAIKLQAKS